MTGVMNEADWLLLVPLLVPLAGGLCVGGIRALDTPRRRRIFVLSALVLEAAAVILTAARPDSSLTLFRIGADLPVLLRLDGAGRLFAILAAGMFLCVGVYSFEYMRHEQHEKRFYAFWLLTLFALEGLALSGGIIAYYMFYEAMTLLSLPLVTHTQTREAVAAGIKYLIYSVLGASLALAGVFLISRYTRTLAFTPGGALDPAKTAGHEPALLAALFVMILGFSVKAGMFPLHGWLPTAHPVAPAPASAVLSGVITKAGALGILRVIYGLSGPGVLVGTWVQTALLILSLLTVTMGSLLAFKENVLKKRLAYSSVSQVSYVLFGLFTLNAAGLSGALLHMVFHSIIKNALFMIAGAIIFKTGKTLVSELTGIGKRMPRTMLCHTVVSMGLVGIPPTCGFISKWYLAQGGLSMASAWNWTGPALLLLSAVLTAGYLLSISIRGFFPGEDKTHESFAPAEPSPVMWGPILLLALFCLGLGLFPTALTDWTHALAAALAGGAG